MSVAAAAMTFFRSVPALVQAAPGGIGPGLVYDDVAKPFVRCTNLGETGREAFGGFPVSPYFARDRFQLLVVCDGPTAAEDAERVGRLIARTFDPATLQLDDGTCLNLENELMLGPVEDPKLGQDGAAVYTFLIRYSCFKVGTIVRA